MQFGNKKGVTNTQKVIMFVRADVEKWSSHID